VSVQSYPRPHPSHRRQTEQRNGVLADANKNQSSAPGKQGSLPSNGNQENQNSNRGNEDFKQSRMSRAQTAHGRIAQSEERTDISPLRLTTSKRRARDAQLNKAYKPFLLKDSDNNIVIKTQTGSYKTGFKAEPGSGNLPTRPASINTHNQSNRVKSSHHSPIPRAQTAKSSPKSIDGFPPGMSPRRPDMSSCTGYTPPPAPHHHAGRSRQQPRPRPASTASRATSGSMTSDPRTTPSSMTVMTAYGSRKIRKPPFSDPGYFPPGSPPRSGRNPLVFQSPAEYARRKREMSKNYYGPNSLNKVNGVEGHDSTSRSSPRDTQRSRTEVNEGHDGNIR